MWIIGAGFMFAGLISMPLVGIGIGLIIIIISMLLALIGEQYDLQKKKNEEKEFKDYPSYKY